MRERKGVMDARSDAFLGLPGGLGTLEELLEVWVARSLGMHAKPIVVLDPDGTFAGLHALVDALVAQSFVRPEARDAVEWAQTVPEAFALLERAWGSHELSPEPTPRRCWRRSRRRCGGGPDRRGGGRMLRRCWPSTRWAAEQARCPCRAGRPWVGSRRSSRSPGRW